MDVNRYLNRIAFKSEISPTLEALRQLQKSHLLAVPFENLDIHADKPISLNQQDLFEKVVVQQRGGFCFELNGLFCSLLKKLGFNARLISAQVYSKEGEYGAPFDHAAIVVAIENSEYLVDVGFGEFAFEPLKIELNQPLHDERGRFIIEQFDETRLVVSKMSRTKKKPEYIFELVGRNLEEFHEMCRYHQTSEASPFTQRKLITLPLKNGRITLTTDKFIHKAGSRVKMESVPNEDIFNEKLEAHFGYSLAPVWAV